jgi:hypothetical protein
LRGIILRERAERSGVHGELNSPRRHRDHGVRDFKTFKIRNLVSRDVVVGNHPTPIVGRWTKVGRRSEATELGIGWDRMLGYF